MKDFIAEYNKLIDYILKINNIINASPIDVNRDIFLRQHSNQTIESLIMLLKTELKHLELTLDENKRKLKMLTGE